MMVQQHLSITIARKEIGYPNSFLDDYHRINLNIVGGDYYLGLVFDRGAGGILLDGFEPVNRVVLSRVALT